MNDNEIAAIEDQAQKWKDFPGIQGTLAKLLLVCLKEIHLMREALARIVSQRN